MKAADDNMEDRTGLAAAAVEAAAAPIRAGSLDLKAAVAAAAAFEKDRPDVTAALLPRLAAAAGAAAAALVFSFFSPRRQ